MKRLLSALSALALLAALTALAVAADIQPASASGGYVQGGFSYSTQPVNLINAPFSGLTQANDLLAVFITRNVQTGTTTLDDSAGDSFTQIASQTWGPDVGCGGPCFKAEVWIAPNSVGGALSINVRLSTTAIMGVKVSEYSGLQKTVAQVVGPKVKATGSGGGTFTSPSITPDGSGATLVSFGAVEGNNQYNGSYIAGVGAGWTQRDAQSNFAVSDKNVTTGSFTSSMTGGPGANRWMIFAIALRIPPLTGFVGNVISQGAYAAGVGGISLSPLYGSNLMYALVIGGLGNTTQPPPNYDGQDNTPAPIGWNSMGNGLWYSTTWTPTVQLTFPHGDTPSTDYAIAFAGFSGADIAHAINFCAPQQLGQCTIASNTWDGVSHPTFTGPSVTTRTYDHAVYSWTFTVYWDDDGVTSCQYCKWLGPTMTSAATSPWSVQGFTLHNYTYNLHGGTRDSSLFLTTAFRTAPASGVASGPTMTITDSSGIPFSENGEQHMFTYTTDLVVPVP
jgi:hypothetical protein